LLCSNYFRCGVATCFRRKHTITAIEGNTLILSEVQQLLDEGRAVGDKELKEYMDVIGYADAAKMGLRTRSGPR
jgi:hypothetical protein